MAIKGITGAMMAGPIETPQLTPFPFEQMLAAKQFEQQRGLAAMESNMKFMDELDTMSTIPGMEDVGEYFTKPYEDEVNKIIDSFGGDMSAAAVPLQNLYFDYQRSMTDDMKAHRKASAAYAAQQANLAKGVEDKTYSSKTAAALLNQQTQQYDQALRGYGMGEGERPTGSSFARTPIAAPDFSADFNEIIDNIKPDTYEQYGIIPVEGKPGMYTYGSSKEEYSSADARQMAAMDHIMRRPDYVDWSMEQYDLGLLGSQYDSSYGTSLDQMKKGDPLLQPLSTDPDERAAQLRRVGAKDEAEYDAMSAQRNIELTDSYNKDIKTLMDPPNNMSREEADEYLATNTWDQSQVEGILYDVAGMARLGAYEKRTLEDISKFDKDKKKSSTTSGTPDVTVPRTLETPEYNLPTDPLKSQTINSKIQSVDEQITEKSKLANPNSGATEFERTEAEAAIQRLTSERANLLEQLTNSQFAEALEATGFGANNWGRDETKGTKSFKEEQAAFDARVNESVKTLSEQYLDREMLLRDFSDGQGDVDYGAVGEALKWAAGMGLEDSEWDDRMANAKKDASGRTDVKLNGRRVDDVLELGKDLRDQFNRLKKADYITRTFNPFQDVGKSEQARINSRQESYIDESLNVYIPHETNPEDGQPVSFQEKHRAAIGDMEQAMRTLRVDDSLVYKNAIIAPQIKATGQIINGQPAFVMDIGYYKPNATAEAIPIPDEVMAKIMENPSNRLASLYSKGEAGRRFIVGIPGETDQVLALADEYIGFAQDTDNPDAQRQKAAQTGVQMHYNLRYGIPMQNTGVETAPSEVFVEDAQGLVHGYVNRAVDASALYSKFHPKKWNNGLMKNDDGTVIFDASKHQMRIEKKTFKSATGEDQISYTLYPYYGGNEKGRDIVNRGTGSLVTTAASIEDLIFESFEGNMMLEAIFNAQ